MKQCQTLCKKKLLKKFGYFSGPCNDSKSRWESSSTLFS